MTNKTILTSLVIIPPSDKQESIQTIRRAHDREFSKWMPHINIIYPFCTINLMDEIIPKIEKICDKIPKFNLTLSKFIFLKHITGRATITLAPEPKEAIEEIQSKIEIVLPEYNDISRFEGGFKPHLSIGQASDEQDARALIQKFRYDWENIEFTVESLFVVSRTDKTPYKIYKEIKLCKKT